MWTRRKRGRSGVLNYIPLYEIIYRMGDVFMTKILTAEIAATLASQIKASISGIIERHGQRPPGSPGERACQEQLKQELDAAGFSAALEPFPVAQKAFMAMPLICSLLTLLSLPLYWIAPRLSPIPVLLAVIVFVCELIYYNHILSYIFPKSTSLNLSAALPPAGERKQRIILAGHADAAYEWRFHRWFPRIFPLFAILLLLSVLYMLITTLAAALTGGVYTGTAFWQWLGLSQAFILPGLLIGLTFTDFKMVSPGAADNLSGALCATELVKWMKAENIALEKTEVTALVTGSEEAGLEGARAYIKAHRTELDSVPTVVIAVDTVSELAHLALYNRDLNGRVAHDPRVCALVKSAGQACGLELPSATVTVGSSDGTAFTQAGIPTAAICAMNPAPAFYYHNRHDTPDVVEEACLAQALQLLLEICVQYDAA